MIENENTYAKALANNSLDEFHKNFDQAINEVEKELGRDYPMIINGKEILSDDKFAVSLPTDRSICFANFPHAKKEDVNLAIESAKKAFPEWSNFLYPKRVQIFRDCAETLSKIKFKLAAILCFENGKNRLESIGEIDETIDFLRFYADQLEINEGFIKKTKSVTQNEKTQSVLKPYGVWGVIAPFNFPSAIAIGMTTGALITGNTVVLKPSDKAPVSSFKFVETIYKKIPTGAINFVTGHGIAVGKMIVESNLIDGFAFTGSLEVGLSAFKKINEEIPKPVISEMGGKNPTIVTKSADLDKATDGVLRAAFGYGGQKCSACSRVYVHNSIAQEFKDKLVQKTKQLKIGIPWKKDVFLGPVINEDAKKKYEHAIELAKKDGKILCGGRVLKDSIYQNGNFVEPTVVSDLSENHELVKKELFLPFLCVQEYENFDDAIKMANNIKFGLTAGIFSEDKEQIEKFFNSIQAGVTYANRAASATTAASPQSQPFVGWKGSGISGKGSGGPYYLQQFMREQTQTVCE
ncbi:MAG: aldehyde dehydrogenase family protein [Marine Group I thaumarchaeote]|nr:MAG: aldehyde dehydrogenase family protein [Marine Group I thaumarchaeote]